MGRSSSCRFADPAACSLSTENVDIPGSRTSLRLLASFVDYVAECVTISARSIPDFYDIYRYLNWDRYFLRKLAQNI